MAAGRANRPDAGAVGARIAEAIRARRLVSFTLDGRARVAEPHDFGVVNGEEKLFFHQVGGESRSGRPFGWRWAVLDKIEALEVLERTFDGPRPAPSGRHVRWERLIASVSEQERKKS